ncbi:SGNH/GDSL hydrolase family protein [Blastopirellula sp. JC732]|uniref:SGNH/GDSL hydrolase family protein n=1 Tax=Blastopirellula sediminis TaxID=2894196 RepID=A0A9X1MIL0_9BACT|nr:SGNH/GDSL hydrolase family protein [Blastopirellula sediminis]MCC9604300.1 SGNH/GDSL hydrolase family protein [Blastopirellula sediminis]MCC9626820.1 SGNH/GDSL hydrolase family protein [Blastopirellula sediminis]
MYSVFPRRHFLALTSAAAASVALPTLLHAAAPEPKVEDNVAWYDVQEWGVEGKGWDDAIRYYDRLPGRAEKKVRGAVWSLSRHSAGMLTRFETDAPAIHVRYKLLSNSLDMPHMPATGVSGVDLYARNEQGEDRWLAVSRPAAQEVNAVLVNDIDPRPNGQPRLYTLYLPLYNGVDKLEIGVPKGSKFAAVAPRDEKPIVFYGTSIMHGACASRPGMSISGIVGRRMNRPVINLGFSGNGRLEAEVGEFLTELDPAVYVIDCLPNVDGPVVAEKTEPLVMQLRKAHPDTPILLVEDRTYTYAPFKKSARARHEGSRKAFRQAFENLQAAGVKDLYYLPGDGLLGDDGEAATDGSHPSDLGMVRYADAYVPALEEILNKK